ncbi:MAG: PDZ domain-containing protein [Pyrinomonadaceae bacterium]
MPPELRFCRSCGSRLGEGVAEYTETVRFQNTPTAATAANPTTYGVGSGPQGLGPAAAGQMQWIHKKKKKKISGMTWLFIGLLIFFVSAAAFTAVVRNVRQNTGAAVVATPRAYVGVDEFKNGDGGATFNNVDTPDGPADKAGLLGGDLITSFDGHAVKDADEITGLLRQTTIGKAVEVTYIRDGETKKTLLTPVAREELRQMERAFSRRPEGLGRFGYDDDQAERVLVPGTNTYGVRLGNITTSLPADMAGIKEGDIVIEFGKIPIRTPGELRSRVRRALPYSIVDVVLIRGNQPLTIPVKMGRQN